MVARHYFSLTVGKDFQSHALKGRVGREDPVISGKCQLEEALLYKKKNVNINSRNESSKISILKEICTSQTSWRKRKETSKTVEYILLQK
jgi:hypothetical protein